MSGRAGLFDEGEDFDGREDFDVAGFAPKKPNARKEPEPAMEAVRAVSEAAQFRSREPVAPRKKREPMRHRTGRSVQFNVKLRADTIESFYEIAKRQKWTLGQTIEHALAALDKQLGLEL